MKIICCIKCKTPVLELAPGSKVRASKEMGGPKFGAAYCHVCFINLLQEKPKSKFDSLFDGMDKIFEGVKR